MQEAGELAATTAKLLNVSEFSSVDEATSALVSSLQAFTTEGQDVGQRAEEIVDILNHIGNRYPVATNELAEGLATSGAALVAANNSIEEQVALLSAGNATMQDVSTVAAGLKIVAARLRGTTTEADDDAESAVTNVSKLQEKIKALTAEANGGEGIDIINEQGEYKSTFEILSEISKIFDKMDDMSAASLLELIAGKNRSSVVAAILQNGDILEEAYADAFQADSSAQKELDTYRSSIQGHIDQFNNAVQTMWMNFIDSSVIKFIVDLGTGLAQLVDKANLLKVAFAGFLTYLNLTSKKKFDLSSILGVHKPGESFLDGFSIFGKEGFSGWIAKQFKRTKKIDIPLDNIEVSTQDFADAIRNNISDYVTIDTSRLDAQIETVQNKLMIARKNLDDARKADWNYYKLLGSKSPKTDRDNRVSEQIQQIKTLEAELTNLQARKDGLINLTVNSTAKSITDSINNETKAYESMLSILSEVQNKKLTIGNEQYAATQIDEISKKAKVGQTELANYLSTLSNVDDTFGDANTSLKAYVASVDDGNYSLAGFQKFITQHNSGLKASGTAAKAAAVGHQLLNAALSIGVTALASFAIDLLVKGYDSLVNATANASAAAEEALSTYRETKKTLDNQKETVENLAESYNKLYNGVNAATNENMGLTVEAHKEYLDVCNKIADMFPSLISGYDAEGNAIIDLKGNVEALTDAYEEMAQTAMADVLTSESKTNIWKSYQDLVNKGSWFNARGSLVEQRDVLELFSRASNEELQAIADVYYKSAGGSYKGVEKHLNSTYGMNIDGIYDLVNEKGINFNQINTDIDSFRRVVNEVLSQVNTDISEQMGNIKETVAASLLWDESYQKLDDDTKAIMDTIVNNLDPNMITQMGATGIDDLVSKLLANIKNTSPELIDGITSAQSDVAKAIHDNDSAAFSTAKTQFESIIPSEWRGKSGEIVVDENADAVTQYLQGVAKAIENQSKNYEVKLQFKEEYESSLAASPENNYDADYKVKQQEAQELVNSYKSLVNELQTLGVDPSQTVFGNIDTNNRQVLEWTDDNLAKYRTILESWHPDMSWTAIVNDYVDTISTVLGTSGEYDGVEIAFSPMLQTENGAVILDNDTVDKYIFGLIDKAGEGWTGEDLLRLDTEGLEVDGQIIKGLIADVGDTAIQTQEAMHYTGIDGAIAGGWKQIEAAAKQAGVSAEAYVEAVQKGDWDAIGIDMPEAPQSTTASDLLSDTDANTYISNARKMSKESYALAEAQQAMVNSLAGDDKVLYSDELTDMYDQWIAAGNKAPDGANWTDDQIAGLQILDALIQSFNTDIDTIKQSLIDLGLVEVSLGDITSFNIASEATQELVNQFTGNINTIKEAWSSLNSGEMAKGDFIDLAMQFPELMDGVNLADDNWIVKAKENLEELNKVKIDDFINVLNQTKAAMEARGEDTSVIDSFINYANQIKNQPISYTEPESMSTTYSALVSEVESYNEVLTQTSEVVFDNVEVTQEYKDSLKELGISEEELGECFDENNGLIVKNASVLRKLIAQKKQDKQATIQQAKSMSQLQYKNTVQQLQQVVKAMALEVRASGFVSSATLKTTDILREQLTALKQTIQQYALLEISLSDAANAYSEFEAAKERDAQLTYGDSMVEMLQTINEGFKTGQVGTEAFEYAVKVIVPESEYAHIDNIEQRMIAIHDYIDKNPLFADWFTIDEGEFSITLDNINSFIDDAFGAGLFTGDSSGEFFLTDAIKNAQDPLKEFADQLGEAFNTQVTEGSVLAMLSELEKYDASWGNILTDLTTTPLDRAINDATTALEEAIAAQEEFITSGGDLNSDAYKQIEQNIKDASSALDTASKNAANNAQVYTQVEAVLKGMSGEIEYSEKQANLLAQSLGLVNENGKCEISINEDGTLSLTQSQLDILNEKLTGLSKPTILDVQLAYDELDRQLQELEAYKNGGSNDILAELKIDSSQADNKIAELTATKEAIELVYNITTTSTEQNTGTLEKLGTWETNGVNIVVRADTTEFDAAAAEMNAVEMGEKPVTITTNAPEANAEIDSVDDNDIADKKPGIYMQGVSTALNNIDSINDALYALPYSKTIDVYVNYVETGAVSAGRYARANGTAHADGTAHVEGTAFAGGNWGAPRTETALMAEVGPELLVRDGRWQLVGQDGATFHTVKKGDIIFNHKQTEQLLKNGYVTGRGKAYAKGTVPNSTSGTAYYQTFGGYVGDNDVFVDGSDKWMDPWTNSFDDAADSLSDAADSISDAADTAEQVVDFVEMKLEEIEAIIEKTTAKIANFLDDTTSIKSKDELYDELVKAEKYKSETYLKAAQKYNVEAAAALSGVPQKYQEMARNGAIAIKDFIGENQVEIAEKIQEYRDWAAKADEAENGHLEAIAAISAHRVEQLEDIATDFENIISISKSHSDLLQAEMDFIEESGNRLSESYYEELKKHTQQQLDDMQNERVALQKILDDAVAAGDVVIGSDDWYSMLETIYEVDQEIVDCKTSLEEFQNAINELYWDNFSKFIDEIDAVNSELSNLFDLISDDDKIVDEMGSWTDEGITSLGLLAQQMENAQFKSEQYGEAIEKLKKDYADGLYSTDEYNEKLSELTDSQYDAIKSYEDAKDAIVDLNKTRAEAVKKYLQDEIDKYSELIDKKKESLSEDKAAYDFQKQTQESTKNIEDIERKIAALSGDTSSSAMAQRKRLEAELSKAREELQDLYYDHSIEKQQEALDKELEGYTQNKQDQMDALDEYLEKESQVIADSFDLVAENTKTIVNTLTQISEDYGVTISDTIATPWVKGANAIGTYEEQLNTSVSNTTKNLEALKQQLEDLQAQADKTAESIVNVTHSTIAETNDGHQTSIKGYAKGSKSIEYDQWALIDELGDELQLVPNSAGRLDYIKKGTGILNNTLTERLMNLAMDPTSMIESNRPTIGAPGITTTNNTITIDNSVGTLLHVEHLDGSNPAEVAKLVDKAWEKKMQTLNNSIKKFTR